MLITAAEQDLVLLHTGHLWGIQCSKSWHGACGVCSLVSRTVREDICAKCLQGTSSIQASTSQNVGLLVASLMDGSEEGNVYRGWWALSSLHVPWKNFSCQSSTEIYTTFCLNKENYRKNCVFFPAIAESGGGGDEKLRVVILVPWESSSQLGTIVSLSICPLGAHSKV